VAFGMSDKWLNRERLTVYPRIFLALYILAILFWLAMADGVFDMLGRPLGTDFTSFYSAARLALSGQASLAYDFVAHFHAERTALGAELKNYYSFSYPPTFLLIVAPLGALPYLPALFIWQGLTLAFFVTMVRKLAGRREAIMLTLAFPVVFITLGHGQNAFLTAGLLAGALHYLDRKPIVAGVLIGLLTFKPHLGVLIPFVLMLSGRWRVFFSAGVTTALFAALSWAVFGAETWRAFLASTGKAAEVLNQGQVAFHKMQSLFSALRALGMEPGAAFVAHTALALAAAGTVLWVWRQKVDVRLHYAALGTGTLMMSPFLLDYDLAILAVPIACLAVHGQTHGYRAGLINLLCVAYLAPLVLRRLNMLVAVPWTPILLSFLLYQVARAVSEQRKSN